MKCTRCGTEFPQNIMVCPKCGMAVNQSGMQGQSSKSPQPVPFNGQQAKGPQPVPFNGQQAKGPQPVPFNGQQVKGPQQAAFNPQQPQKPKKKLSKKVVGMIAGGVTALIAIIVTIIIIAVQPKKINLEDYVEISCNGYNGYGTAQVYLDSTSLYSKILEANGKNNKYDSLSGLSSSIKNAAEIEDAVSKIKLKVKSDTSNLSNGDTIKVSISYDNDAAKKVKVKFKGDTVSKKVSGLDKVEEINPFEGLEVNFDGTSPNGKVSWSYSGSSEYLSDYSFSADPYNGLRNGDTVTVSVKSDDESTLQNGYVFSPREKEYKVEGLDEYVDKYADLTDDFVNKLKKDAEDIIYSYTANSYGSETTMSDLTYAGYIFLNIKDGSNYGDANDLYLIYKGTVSNSKGTFNTTDVYYPVKFYNILSENGELSKEDSGSIIGSSSFSDNWNSTKGYTNPLTCYMDIVEQNSEKYNSECGGGFESNSKYSKVKALSEISDDGKNTIHEDAKQVIEKYVAESYSDKSQVTDLNVVGEYLLVSKSAMSDYVDDTILYIVYSGTVSNSEGSFDTTTVYFPVEYRGIYKMDSGSYELMESNGIQGSSSFSNSWYYTKGYMDGSTMFDKLVNTQRTNYTYEVSSGLEQFGK